MVKRWSVSPAKFPFEARSGSIAGIRGRGDQVRACLTAGYYCTPRHCRRPLPLLDLSASVCLGLPRRMHRRCRALLRSAPPFRAPTDSIAHPLPQSLLPSVKSHSRSLGLDPASSSVSTGVRRSTGPAARGTHIVASGHALVTRYRRAPRDSDRGRKSHVQSK